VFEQLQGIKSVPLKYIPNCFAQMNGWTKKSNFEEVKEIIVIDL
jgi:hypothetical protein